MNKIMENFTPRNLITGHLKASRTKDVDAAALAAASVLGCDSVALVCTRAQGEVWYLACPAADLASHPDAETSLAAALPGAPGHEGEGAYLCDLAGGLKAVVVKHSDNLHCFVGSPAMAERFATLEQATATHSCAGKGLTWLMPAAARTKREALLTLAVTASGLLVAVIAALTWGLAARDVSHQTELREALQKEHLKGWTTALASLEPPAYPKALADLQKAVTQAVQEKGALVEFDYHDGRATWTLNASGRVVAGGSK
jgi:hypothetical protein